MKIGPDDPSQNPSDVELPWLGNSTYRMHRFRSSASPIKGLTRQLIKFNEVLQILDRQHPPALAPVEAETTGIATPAEVGVQVIAGP